MGGQKLFFFPPSPLKIPSSDPSKLCSYVGLYVPYKPWKFGKDWQPNFWVSPFENMGSCVRHTGEYPRERSQLLILLHNAKMPYIVVASASFNPLTDKNTHPQQGIIRANVVDSVPLSLRYCCGRSKNFRDSTFRLSTSFSADFFYCIISCFQTRILTL